MEQPEFCSHPIDLMFGTMENLSPGDDDRTLRLLRGARGINLSPALCIAILAAGFRVP